MSVSEALEKLLRSFERYYNIKREGAVSPFVAEAEFHSHTEQYLLVKAAHLSDIDSNEFIFFSTVGILNLQNLAELDSKAWEEGLSRVKPYNGHRNSDIALIVLAEKIEEDAFKQIKKLKHYKSYKFSLWGWSHFKVIAMETSTNRFTYNRFGSDFKKIFTTIN
ncbi:MAG: hypothetical protein KBT11_09965 [Treponema sp.]|nr:hypothetical protein [Candidatus Treponema equifaecale]